MLPNLAFGQPGVSGMPMTTGTGTSGMPAGLGMGGAAGATGHGAYGSVPQPISAPQSIYQQATQAAPGLPGLTQSATSAIQSELSGAVSPETQKFLQDQAAAYGVSMGVGGGIGGDSFNTNNLLTKLGLTSEGLVQQGIQNYNAFLPTLANTQLNPDLQAQIATQNSIWAAAPDPASAAQQQVANIKDLYNFEQAHNPATGTTGETSGDANDILNHLPPGTYQSAPGEFHTPHLGFW